MQVFHEFTINCRKFKKKLKKMDQYQKDNKSFQCGEQGHVLCMCPKKTQGNGTPKAFVVEVLKKEGNSKVENLSYVLGKVRQLNTLILFDLGSTHNFISHELALKLGIHEVEMGGVILAKGAFKGKEVSITPFNKKLQLHIQGYVDKEDFYITPLKHKDVILGALWFDCMHAHIKFLERKVLFTCRGKYYALTCNSAVSTIPIVALSTFDNVMKNYVSSCMVFTREHERIVSELNDSKSETKEELELAKFLRGF